MSGYSSKDKDRINLFEIATSELSQDAFLVWLISHAAAKYKNEKLHACAIGLLTEFYKLANEKGWLRESNERADIEAEEAKTVELISIERQINNIDILIFAKFDNEKCAIVIEDKTFSSEHDNQLETYKNYVKEKYKDYTFIGIYYKLGYQSNIEAVEKSKYVYFNREMIISFFDKYNHINSEIFRDYFEYVKKYKEDSDYMKKESIEDWTYDNYCDFYENCVLNRINYPNLKSEYDYVSNPGGGFCGLWITGEKYVNLNNYIYEVYLQLEPKNNDDKKYLAICLKLGLHGKLLIGDDTASFDEVDHRKNRDDFIDGIKDNCGNFLEPSKLGSRLSSGNTMTVKIYGCDDEPNSKGWKDKLIESVNVYSEIVDNSNLKFIGDLNEVERWKNP